jgi:catechol 2,3-dioxygenase-like lactoylglutathione lyase family enzyme
LKEFAMPAISLNHYTIRPRDLEVTKDFYADVVGLKVGDRPPLAFEGYWLYAGDTPVVHLIGKQQKEIPIVDHTDPAVKVTRLDHVAFSCEGLADMRKRLKKAKLKFEERVLPRLNMTQLFTLDPDGIDVELNFDPRETGS